MKKINLILIGAIFLFGCKKNKNDETPDPAVPSAYSYQPLKVGNYWVYNTYFYSYQTQDTSSFFIDSTVVVKDTTIHGNIFYKIEFQSNTNSRSHYFLRDSLGYLVDETGRKHMSVSNFTDILFTQNLEGVDISYKMTDKDVIINIPAGAYAIINYQGTFISPADNSVRTVNNYYSNNIGKVKQVNPFLYGQACQVRDLHHYYIQ